MVNNLKNIKRAARERARRSAGNQLFKKSGAKSRQALAWKDVN